MHLSSFFSIALVSGLALAVPTAEENNLNAARRDARGLSKRTFYTHMLNTTCVLAPETPREDYVANPPIRVDITENQPGVLFTVDIGVLNTETCQPLTNVLVELWSSNAVGQYGTTFLRGATTTAPNGIAEFKTIFPGYTSDGANHLNIVVHSSSSESSSVIHSGRLFFTDPWTDIIGMYMNYAQNSNRRVKNANDPTFAAANKNGYNSIIDVESIGDDWADPEGIIGYITVGVNA
ncbi:aromatic compound dioxygenase [Mycena albidolilacea]|uniref:Aromatic compound dioxygenase n=1 Tax=Mycena albidolilacea TaxID=1033008 RepID=A0AAD7AKN2_9AGAR|nr:aromatic compound dioxygenase [Mycena albidolilacea]